MCYHYQYGDYDPSLAADLLSLHAELYKGQLPFGGFYPLAQVPVVRDTERGRELTALEWGLLPSWWKPKGKQLKRSGFQRKLVNCRSETAREKPSYRSAFKSRRCLLLVDKFFDGGHWFYLPDEKPFTFAGLWESWTDGEETVESCTMLTTEANDVVGKVHDRMPVILAEPGQREEWLDVDRVERESLEHLFVPFGGEMVAEKGSKLP